MRKYKTEEIFEYLKKDAERFSTMEYAEFALKQIKEETDKNILIKFSKELQENSKNEEIWAAGSISEKSTDFNIHASMSAIYYCLHLICEEKIKTL